MFKLHYTGRLTRALRWPEVFKVLPERVIRMIWGSEQLLMAENSRICRWFFSDAQRHSLKYYLELYELVILFNLLLRFLASWWNSKLGIQQATGYNIDK